MLLINHLDSLYYAFHLAAIYIKIMRERERERERERRGGGGELASLADFILSSIASSF